MTPAPGLPRRTAICALWCLLALGGCRDTTGPGAVVDPKLAVDVAAGGSHTCALAVDGTAFCWGENGAGQLGNGTRGDGSLRPVPVLASLRFASISTSSFQTWALTGAGEPYGWGGIWTTEYVTAPRGLGGPGVFRDVTAGDDAACALDQAGVAYCWGVNSWGEVGDGTTKSRPTPVAVKTDRRFRHIGAGEDFACGLTVGGAVLCWGGGGNGQLGDGQHQGRLVPGPVQGLLTFTVIATGGSHACALASGGQAYCWGANYDGQVGDGTAGNFREAPTRAAEGITLVSLALGGYHSCGLAADGTAYCWGRNDSGQLGDGTYRGRGTPGSVTTSMHFVRLSLGDRHTCGRTREGSVYCWGDNTSGQLGDGSGARSWPVPVLVRW